METPNKKLTFGFLIRPNIHRYESMIMIRCGVNQSPGFSANIDVEEQAFVDDVPWVAS